MPAMDSKMPHSKSLIYLGINDLISQKNSTWGIVEGNFEPGKLIKRKQTNVFL